MKIKFLSDYQTKSNPPTVYKVGDTLDCSNATGNHFINRNVAIEVESCEVKVEPKKSIASESSETGGSSQQDPASVSETPAKRGRPRKKAAAKSSSSTTTTDTQN